MERVNLATMEINCLFAHKVKGDTAIYHECQSEKSRFHLKAVSQAYCTRCKVRMPLILDAEPVIEHIPVAQQMCIEEWLKGGMIYVPRD